MVRKLQALVASLCLALNFVATETYAQEAMPASDAKGKSQDEQLQREIQSLQKEADELRLQTQQSVEQGNPLKGQSTEESKKPVFDPEKLRALRDERRQELLKRREQIIQKQQTLADAQR